MAWKDVQYENGKYRTNEGGGGGGSSTFAGLDDVSFNNLQNGQVPKYNSDTGKWENANESGGSSSHTYSTTEQVVGVYTDGKPVYEISVTDKSIGSGITVIFNNLSIKKLVSASGELVDASNIGYVFPYYFTDSQYCRVMADKSSIWSNAGVVCQTSNNTIFRTISCTIRYTKTTD